MILFAVVGNFQFILCGFNCPSILMSLEGVFIFFKCYTSVS